MKLSTVILPLFVASVTAQGLRKVKGVEQKARRATYYKSKSGTGSEGCTDCDVCCGGKPTQLILRYNANGADSTYQPEGKANCLAGTYPAETDVCANGQSFDRVTTGTEITLIADDKFSAETEFEFKADSSFNCYIHTSCSVPLVPGDQIGPWIVIGDGTDCASSPPATNPPGAGTCDYECVICDRDNKVRPQELTLKYHGGQGLTSNYQADKATCDVTQTFFEGETTITAYGVSHTVNPGETFTILASDNGGRLDANTEFTFSPDPGSVESCEIHTSCSAPLVRGDRIGPFEVMGGNECEVCPPTDGGAVCCEVAGAFDSTTGTITVDFRNQCEGEDPSQPESKARPQDFVGLYPCDFEVDTDHPDTTWTPRPNNEPGAWLYHCFLDGSAPDAATCQLNDNPPTKFGELLFQKSTAPQFTQNLPNQNGKTNYDANGNFPPGCYVAVMNHLSGESYPPYDIACKSNEFQVTAV